MSQRPSLGKGLASLLPGAATSAGPQIPAALMQQTPPALGDANDRMHAISMVSPDDIVVNPYQPRREFDSEALEELAQSIRTNGVIQPLVVRKTAQGLQLIAGERRLRASKIAGVKQVPVVIRKSTDREALELALIENIQRQDLNCVDAALAYFQLAQEFSLTQEEIAVQVGKDRATVANHLRLLRLPEPALEDLKSGALSFGHGKALLALEDHDLRMKLRQEILTQGLNVRDAEALANSWKKSPPVHAGASVKPPAGTPTQQRLSQLSIDLTRQWASRVEIKGTEKKGKIIFQYRTREDLDRLLSALQNQRL